MKRKQTDTIKNTTSLGESKKIVLLGDGGIGKTTMFEKLRHIKDDEYRFNKSYNATDNFDFDRIKIQTDSGYAMIDIWDTAGQENRGGKLRDAYLKGADAILLLYDISKSETVKNIPKWFQQINQVAPKIPVAVIGNKADLLSELQQCECVKLRECNLQRDLGHSKVKNFLVSIKEDTHIESTTSYWSGSVTHTEKTNCLIGLEYLMSQLYDKPVKLA